MPAPGVAAAPWIGPAIMGGTNVLSGGLSQMFGASNAKDAYERNAQLAADAFNRSRAHYVRRYRDTAVDMKHAGLNPIMLATSGFDVGSNLSGVQAQSPAAGMPNFDIASSARSFSEMERNTSEKTKNIAQARLFRKQRLTEVQRANKEMKMAVKLNREASVLHQQVDYWTNAAAEMEKRIQVTMKQPELMEEQKNHLVAQWQVIEKEARKIEAMMPKLEAESEVYRHKVGKILMWIKEIRTSFGASLNAILPVGLPKGVSKTIGGFISK